MLVWTTRKELNKLRNAGWVNRKILIKEIYASQ